jgi:hypothetical protein
MIQFNDITTFQFKTAEYSMVSSSGDAAILQVDYEHNTFEIVNRPAEITEEFRQEAGRIARDLLSRKHGINVAAAPATRAT